MRTCAHYTVELTHDPQSGWWLGRVLQLRGVLTQGRTIEQTMERVRGALWAYSGDKASAYSAVLTQVIRGLPRPLLASIERARCARRHADAEQARAGIAIRKAAAELSRRGLSARDVGELLGVSRQRAHQLLKAG